MAIALSQYQFQALVGMTGFKEQYFSSNPGAIPNSTNAFPSFHARLGRYDVYWAHYEGNVYRRLHLFQPQLKAEYDLYSATRTVFSPAYRLGEFWSEHLLGGRLDPECGDGVEKPSAIPIVTTSPKTAALRAVLAQVFRDSNWQANKDNWTRFGSVLGDVGLMAFDDPGRQKVFLRVIHPRIVRDVDLDLQGNCKGYVFEEWRPDPRFDDRLITAPYVRYNEVASRVGGRVQYETFLDGELYDWKDYEDERVPRIGPTWTEDYGFVPFVWHQHRDMGLGAGWSELHPSLSKLMEVDDLASKIDDQVRKIADCPWFFSGTNAADLAVSYGEGTSDDPDPVRTKIPYICSAAADAKPSALIAPMDVAAASEHALKILEELERDHQELLIDQQNQSGSASGRALRVARKTVESRVVSRRAGYDDAQVRAYAMAISIGAQKGYPGFEAFDEGSFARGELAMSIGERPVFTDDEMDHIDQVTARSIALSTMTNAGVPLATAMELAGFPPDAIERMQAAQAAEERKAAKRVAERMQLMGGEANGFVGAQAGNGQPASAGPVQAGGAAP
jgi:hypothetical protein